MDLVWPLFLSPLGSMTFKNYKYYHVTYPAPLKTFRTFL